jgi:membrane fusion protein, multidrug efflux system
MKRGTRTRRPPGGPTVADDDRRPARGPLTVARRALVVLGAALGLVACGSRGPGGDRPRGPQPVTVVTLKAGPVTLTRELPGRTSAFLVADVRPQVTGIVKKRLFNEGSTVRAGETLYQLDDAVYRAQYQSSEAALAKAEAALEKARLAAARSAELVKTGVVSSQDNDTAVATHRQAVADVAAAKAELEMSRVNLAYARVVAPIGGRIGKSTVTAGALVVANQNAALATIQQLDPIYVEVSQSSSDWLRLREAIDLGRLKAGGAGTGVTIVLEDGRRYPHEGRLQFADVTVDPGTGSFALRVLVPNPENLLLPGMYVTAVLDEGVRSDAVLVPEPGITRNPKGGATALIVGKDGKVELLAVHVSRTVGDQWLVEDGLKAGDRVIIEGLQKVQPGKAVAPTEAGTEIQPAAAKP